MLTPTSNPVLSTCEGHPPLWRRSSSMFFAPRTTLLPPRCRTHAGAPPGCRAACWWGEGVDDEPGGEPRLDLLGGIQLGRIQQLVHQLAAQQVLLLQAGSTAGCRRTRHRRTVCRMAPEIQGRTHPGPPRALRLRELPLPGRLPAGRWRRPSRPGSWPVTHPQQPENAGTPPDRRRPAGPRQHPDGRELIARLTRSRSLLTRSYCADSNPHAVELLIGLLNNGS